MCDNYLKNSSKFKGNLKTYIGIKCLDIDLRKKYILLLFFVYYSIKLL